MLGILHTDPEAVVFCSGERGRRQTHTLNTEKFLGGLIHSQTLSHKLKLSYHKLFPVQKSKLTQPPPRFGRKCEC